MKEILLRFRDTDVNNTIENHTNIIEKNGLVWWGWWKKESEPSRIDELSRIAPAIAEVPFILFDKSTERYFLAKAQSIIFASEGGLIPCPDKNLCPSYYHDSNLPAWFCFESIAAINEEKYIAITQQLQTLNYTFYSINDLTPKQRVKRIKLASNNILHLSDIHLGNDHGFPLTAERNRRPLLDIIKDYIENTSDEPIGLLVVSGDITSQADTSVLLSSGLSFLNKLAEVLNISKNNIVIIPGNHDIALKNANFQNYEHEQAFRFFLEKFYGAPKELHGIDYFELPSGKHLDILRINSVRLRKKEESNYGYVEIPLYNNYLKELKTSDSIKIAVIHHHLVSMPAEETLDTSYQYGSISVTIDSGRVIESLHKSGVKVVLNGHQHIPGITKISRGIINDSNVINSLDQDLYILSAGSAGAKADRLADHMRYNSFSIYKLKDENSIEIICQQYNPSRDPSNYFKSKIIIQS